MPALARSKKSKPGPFSRDRALASVDRRSKAGRTFKHTVASLVEHIGGDPTPAQALIIQSAALKATRLYLLSERFLDGADLGEKSDHHALAWLNSLRLDLQALGLERRALNEGDGSKLAKIIARHKIQNGDARDAERVGA